MFPIRDEKEKAVDALTAERDKLKAENEKLKILAEGYQTRIKAVFEKKNEWLDKYTRTEAELTAAVVKMEKEIVCSECIAESDCLIHEGVDISDIDCIQQIRAALKTVVEKAREK